MTILWCLFICILCFIVTILHGGFLQWGTLHGWFIMENSNRKWMMTGGTPISGSIHDWITMNHHQSITHPPFPWNIHPLNCGRLPNLNHQLNTVVYPIICWGFRHRPFGGAGFHSEQINTTFVAYFIGVPLFNHQTWDFPWKNPAFHGDPHGTMAPWNPPKPPRFRLRGMLYVVLVVFAALRLISVPRGTSEMKICLVQTIFGIWVDDDPILITINHYFYH